MRERRLFSTYTLEKSGLASAKVRQNLHSVKKVASPLCALHVNGGKEGITGMNRATRYMVAFHGKMSEHRTVQRKRKE